MIIYYNYLRNLESKIIPLLPPTSWGAFGCQNQYYVNQTVLHMGPQDKAKNQQTCCEELNIYQFETLVNTSMASYLGKSFYINLYNSHLE